jgi:hypothetical protein
MSRAKKSGGLEHITVEAEPMDHASKCLNEGIGNVLDALMTVGAESQGAEDITQALANLRRAQVTLDCELSSARKAADHG